MFADSRLSRHARKHGGRDIRLRSAAVVDGCLKIDFGPDTFAQIVRYGLRASDWKAILFTHSHDDHFAPRELQYMFPPFVDRDKPRPKLCGNETILETLVSALSELGDLDTLELREFETVRIVKYDVTPIRAYHKLDENSFNFIIKGDKTLLYAADTGNYRDATWEFLHGWKLDGAVIECTDGFNPTEYWGHLSCVELVAVVGKLRRMGCLSDRSKVCTTHHAATGEATYDELRSFLEPHGIIAGYDGIKLEL